MLSWLTGSKPAAALVYLPGDQAATADATITRLRARGITNVDVRRPAGSPGESWLLRVDDPHWGDAQLEGVVDPPDPDIAVRFASNLTDAEKARVAPPCSAVSIVISARTKRLLADRKALLRWAAAILGDDGLVALDAQSRLPWAHDALADELAHDADLDIEALYSIEHVYEQVGDERIVSWAHTHGLGDVGAFDMDVLAPHPDFVSQGHEVFRVLAQRTLAKKISIDSGTVVFGEPGGHARLMRAADFMRLAEPRWRDLRDAGHDDDGDRAVLCDAEGGRLSRLLGRGSAPVPLSFARRPLPEPFRSLIPSEFSALMAERAAKTIGLVRRYRDEFARFEVVTLVKLGLPTRRGSPNDREHMWFEVHDIGDDWVDATLTNKPFDVDMRAGDRGRHSLELLSDWTILTPAGPLSPRSSHVARLLREAPAEPSS